MGVEIKVEDLTKSFGKQLIWGDVTLTIPAGEICVMLGPSGTGKSVFLKALIGLLKPDKGSILIEGTDIASCSEKELYEIRKLFGVLFQDGAMFGSMNLYDNVAFPLREHTKKSESEIRDIVMEKMDLVGLIGAEDKRHPLSDQHIAEMLEKQGFNIARRTVTKYRKAMKIPSSRQRKNGNASRETSSRVTACRSSRDRGPASVSTPVRAVTFSIRTEPSSGACARIQPTSCASVAAAETR